jgi:hypothetical protein
VISATFHAHSLCAKLKGMLDGLEAEVALVVDVMLPTNPLVDAMQAFEREFPTVALRSVRSCPNSKRKLVQADYRPPMWKGGFWPIRSILGTIWVAAIGTTGPPCEIGKSAPTWRSAKSQAVPDLLIGARGGNRYGQQSGPASLVPSRDRARE